jgi:hypothetical protein
MCECESHILLKCNVIFLSMSMDFETTDFVVSSN